MKRERTLFRSGASLCMAAMLAVIGWAAGGGPVHAAENTIQLSSPQIDRNAFLHLLSKRASSRAFLPEPLPTPVLSNLMWAAAGISRPESGKRTAPTANNRQEVDVYAVTAQGLYLYDAKLQSLQLVHAGDFRAATGSQAYVKDAAVNLVYVANLTKSGGKTEEDRLIYAAAAVGFISENVYLYCASEGLATVVRAYVDRPVLAEIMKLKPGQRIIFAQSVGYPKP